jgi:Resolvase, N terminal domain
MPNTNGYGPKRAILCARVSTDEQARSGYSLAQQVEALRAYAAREGYEVLEEIQDAGYSGASLERPGMDRVRELVASEGAVAPGGPVPLRLAPRFRSACRIRGGRLSHATRAARSLQSGLVGSVAFR